MNKIFTGIGSRSAPNDALILAACISVAMQKYDFMLYSGNAKGMDRAFEFWYSHTLADSCIFTPPWGLNGYRSPYHTPRAAHDIIKKVHANPSALDSNGKALHARNVQQILGPNLNDANKVTDMVICWTPDGAERFEETSWSTGGTATAIRLADMKEIPIFNLKKSCAIDRICDMITNDHGIKSFRNTLQDVIELANDTEDFKQRILNYARLVK